MSLEVGSTQGVKGSLQVELLYRHSFLQRRRKAGEWKNPL